MARSKERTPEDLLDQLRYPIEEAQQFAHFAADLPPNRLTDRPNPAEPSILELFLQFPAIDQQVHLPAIDGLSIGQPVSRPTAITLATATTYAEVLQELQQARTLLLEAIRRGLAVENRHRAAVAEYAVQICHYDVERLRQIAMAFYYGGA